MENQGFGELVCTIDDFFSQETSPKKRIARIPIITYINK
jgi:hypothetical protein